MSDYKKLTMKEKEEVFENVWSDYSENKIFNKLHVYIAIAAMILFSIVITSNNNDFINNVNSPVYSEIISYDLYEDKELILNESLKDMSNQDLENILAQL